MWPMSVSARTEPWTASPSRRNKKKTKGRKTFSMDVSKAPAPSEKIGRYRWVIVSLLFAAMVINYVDRQTIGLLKADLSKEFGWDETHYADLVFYFQFAYAVAYVGWGKIMDKIGARWGFGVAFAI